MTLVPDSSIPGNPPHEQELFDQARAHQLSHILRTPLTVILAYTELLQAANPRKDQRDGLNAVSRAAASLSSAIDALLGDVDPRLGSGAEAGDSVISALYSTATGVQPAADVGSLPSPRRGPGTGPEEQGLGHWTPLDLPSDALRIPAGALDSSESAEPEAALARVDTMARELLVAQAGAVADRLTGRMIRSAGHVVLQQALDGSFRVGESLLLEMLDTLREALARLQKTADTDFLTGVANKTAIDQRLRGEWQRACRHGRPLAILIVDIDGLQAIDDKRGQPEADHVIVEVARRLVGAVRIEDQVARVGNGEYMIVCPETDARAARAIVRKLARAVVTPPLEGADDSAPVRVSTGWASTSTPYPSAHALVAAADARLRRARRRRPHGCDP